MLGLIEQPKAHGEVFNIGHTKEISIYDLAVLVRQMRGSTAEIVLVPYEQAYEDGFEDMARRVPDISKIQELIGYRHLGIVLATLAIIQGASLQAAR